MEPADAGATCVARIGAAHGVRGAVKLWTFTEDPLAVQSYGPLTRDGARQFEIAELREAKDHLVATFKGVATRNDADRTASNSTSRAKTCLRPTMTNIIMPI